MRIGRLTLVLVPLASSLPALAACGGTGRSAAASSDRPASAATSAAAATAKRKRDGGGAGDGGVSGDAARAPDSSVDGGADGAANCPDYRPLKNLYWGDLHGHTSFSLDAFGF